SQPGVELREGDVIVSLDGVAATSVPDLAVLLRNKAGQKVLLESRRLKVPGTKQSIVTPLSVTGFRNLKTSHWEYTRRLETEARGEGEIGYFHMRGMSASNYSEFVKGYYPVFHRKGPGDRHAPELRRQYRQLDPGAAEPQAVDVLEDPQRAAVRQHAVCLQRTHGGAG
ncbi:MAG: hypothetical protein GWO24_29250, partial [Akkermansiaceae bacterium]|nr:hypothetical protein [Akkermansiaceae bacterium]